MYCAFLSLPGLKGENLIQRTSQLLMIPIYLFPYLYFLTKHSNEGTELDKDIVTPAPIAEGLVLNNLIKTEDEEVTCATDKNEVLNNIEENPYECAICRKIFLQRPYLA